MLHFESDYTTGCHPAILKKLAETNLSAQTGYGEDEFSLSAEKKILSACACETGTVCFLAGGTQTNAFAISTMLSDCEAVLSPATGHVHFHEAGAIEYAGRKVLPLPQKEGKIDLDALKKFLFENRADKNRDHQPLPKMLYLSHPTEYGTLYTKKELLTIRKLCDEFGLYLYLDGARLSFALAADPEVSLPFLAKICDAFYIGGTKCGALIGEALVFPKSAPAHLLTRKKQRGALLAKGRLIGIQFDVLFSDGLYEKIGRDAKIVTDSLVALLKKKGYPFFIDSKTNQQFVVADDATLSRLDGKVAYGYWEKYDETRTVIRFAVGWSTTLSDVEELEKYL